MKHLLRLMGIVMVLAVSLGVAAQDRQQANIGLLQPMHNARYVYVTSYDGPQYSWALIPADRSAISAVEKAFRDSGKYMVVNNPEEAEMIVVVQSRPSEDILAVYDARTWGRETYIWRAMEKDGLASPGVPLYQQLATALEELDQVR